ncbi:MAG TPA: hypothetical protein VLL52_21270, partial [Anaerolineae bacterium]|nr:hypothetical protein [Anaerolineae bacterium]
YNASGQKLIVAWFYHGMANAIIPFFPIQHVADVPQPGYWLWVGLNVVVAIVVAVWWLKLGPATLEKGFL